MHKEAEILVNGNTRLFWGKKLIAHLKDAGVQGTAVASGFKLHSSLNSILCGNSYKFYNSNLFSRLLGKKLLSNSISLAPTHSQGVACHITLTS